MSLQPLNDFRVAEKKHLLICILGLRCVQKNLGEDSKSMFQLVKAKLKFIVSAIFMSFSYNLHKKRTHDGSM